MGLLFRFSFSDEVLAVFGGYRVNVGRCCSFSGLGWIFSFDILS